MWDKNTSQPVGLRKLDSESILKAHKWPWGPYSQTDAVLHQPDSTSLLISAAEREGGERGVREKERWSGSVCPVAYKKSIIVCFYQFGLSQMDPGVNGHHQRAISSDLIYGWEIALCVFVTVCVCECACLGECAFSHMRCTERADSSQQWTFPCHCLLYVPFT